MYHTVMASIHLQITTVSLPTVKERCLRSQIKVPSMTIVMQFWFRFQQTSSARTP